MKQTEILPIPKEIKFDLKRKIKLSSDIKTNEKTESFASAFSKVLLFPTLSVDGESISLYMKEELIAEGYEIYITNVGAEICASGLRGFVYAAATLATLIDKDGYVPLCIIKDKPTSPLRGIHTYLPPSDGIDEFLRIVDALAHLKYNTIFLEIGGGVEYESHPEINAAWKRFCRQTRDYPGGAQGLQGSEIYWKDSTHIELAGGGVLTKAELLKIVNYARSLGIEIIPEIQALSHSYYLTLAHREIAEQPYERFPDTYCPMNEKSYELYFDIARELHELIGFDKVSIGHDEIRVLGRCPVCKNYSGHELLAYEINKLHAFYKSMGVKIFMWGEALQNFKLADGGRIGDAITLEGEFGKKHHRPASYEAIDMIPSDITMLDWCYSMSNDSEDEFLQRGFGEIYGNFSATTFYGFDKRRKKGNVMGAEVSTWCVADENEYGRNGWIFEFAFASELLWGDTYTDEKHTELMTLTADKMKTLRKIIRGEDIREAKEKKFLVSDEGTDCKMSLKDSPCYTQKAFEKMPLQGNFISSDDKSNEFLIDSKAEKLTFIHGADFGDSDVFPRIYTWFFSDLTPRVLGHYAIEYEDGIITSIPVEFGKDIGNLYGTFDYEVPSGIVKRVEDENVKSASKEAEKIEDTSIVPTQLILKDPWITATAYFTDAHKVSIDKRDAMLYSFTVDNPRPDIKIKSIKLYPKRDIKDNNIKTVRVYPTWEGKAEIKLFAVRIT